MRMFLLIFLLFTILLPAAKAQDERYFRGIFEGQLTEKKNKEVHKIIIQSPQYKIDLNRDKQDEIIMTEKKDGIDYFVIKDVAGKTLFSHKFWNIGSEGKIFKVQLKTISPTTDVLIIHHYQGQIDSTHFNGSARIYMLAIDNRNLSKLSIAEGPYFFYENEKKFDKYLVRRFAVNCVDYNKDGVKEVSVNYNNISRVYFYKGEGQFKEI